MDKIHKIDERGRKEGCPFGHCCDSCNLYRPLYTVTKDGVYVAEYDCNWNNLARLQSETKERVLGTQQATESFRNEMVEAQKRPMILVTGDEKRQLRVSKDPL